MLLRQTGQTLRLRVLAPDTVSIVTDDLSKPARPSDAPNPGLRRLRILVRTLAHEPGRLTILAERGSYVPVSVAR